MRASSLVTLCLAAFILAGCDDGVWYDRYYQPVPYFDYCGQFPSCRQCTPIVGCGWCAYGQDQGFCFSEPNQCRTEQFSWTWEAEGCPVDFDSGTGQPDGAADADAAGPALSEAAVGEGEEAGSRDAGDSDGATW
jgi:hypothetical protein